MTKKKSSGNATGAIVAVFVGLAIAGGMKPHHGHGGGVAAHLTSVPGNGGSPSANVQLGQAMAAQMGWTGSQWSCLYMLWEGESAWDQYNTYPSHDTPPSTPGADITTAYGIPQALPAQKMAAAGADWQTNPRTQVKWGLGYIQTTYGNPCSALAFKRSTGNQGY